MIYLIEYDRMSFTDALFLSTSATTTCGCVPHPFPLLQQQRSPRAKAAHCANRNHRLITRNTAELSFMCQAVVLMLMVLGNFVLLTLPPVLLRLHYFRNYFRVTGLRCKRRVGTKGRLQLLSTV